MEYQKILDLLQNTLNQQPKFRTKKFIGINYDPCGTHDKGNQIIFKTSMLKSSLSDYNDAYILMSGI